MGKSNIKTLETIYVIAILLSTSITVLLSFSSIFAPPFPRPPVSGAVTRPPLPPFPRRSFPGCDFDHAFTFLRRVADVRAQPHRSVPETAGHPTAAQPLEYDGGIFLQTVETEYTRSSPVSQRTLYPHSILRQASGEQPGQVENPFLDCILSHLQDPVDGDAEREYPVEVQRTFLEALRLVAVGEIVVEIVPRVDYAGPAGVPELDSFQELPSAVEDTDPGQAHQPLVPAGGEKIDLRAYDVYPESAQTLYGVDMEEDSPVAAEPAEFVQTRVVSDH